MSITEFNVKYKIGSPISFSENGKTIEANLRWPAETLEGNGRPVIWVAGRADAVDLKDVIINPEEIETIKLKE